MKIAPRFVTESTKTKSFLSSLISEMFIRYCMKIRTFVIRHAFLIENACTF